MSIGPARMAAIIAYATKLANDTNTVPEAKQVYDKLKKMTGANDFTLGITTGLYFAVLVPDHTKSRIDEIEKVFNEVKESMEKEKSET